MADENAAQFQERLVDIRATFITKPKPSVLMQPTDRPLDDPAEDRQSTAVTGVPFGQDRFDPSRPQPTATRVGVVGRVALDFFRPLAWTARLAG